MRWQWKARIQRLLSTVPAGNSLYYLLQRHVTRTLPQSIAKFHEVFDIEARHVRAYEEFSDRPLREAVFFQFGAGWTMAGPLTFYGLGVEQQILVDIRRLIRPWLINHSIELLANPEFRSRLQRDVPSLSSRHANAVVSELQARYGIDYRAPADARSTGLPAGSIDCVTSTNTLEHIPREDIAGILKECFRILRPGGLMSFQVDYQDHYSYFDRSVSVYNFLRYSDREWQQFNPSLHYQNRMRHADYLSLYANAGFEVLEDAPFTGTPADRKFIESLQLDARFQGRSPEELAIRTSRIVLQKPVTVNSATVSDSPAEILMTN